MSITEEQIRSIVHQELKRILDTGLMYTETAKPQPDQTQQPKSDLPFNPDLCNWQPKQGENGFYESCKDGTNYALLKQYLNEHQGKARLNGLFYWQFTKGDPNQIGRKPKNGE